MTDVISIGDAAEDVFLELEEARVHCDKGPGTCMICFHYADKVPVKSIIQMFGGNAANNAVGLRRLGLKTSLYTELGDDDPADEIRAMLKREHIDASFVFTRKKSRTNMSVILNFLFERTIFTYHQKRSYSFPRLKPARFVYFTSMGEGYEKILPSLEKYLRQSGALMFFNPGTWQLKSPEKILRRILLFSHCLILNKEEARVLAQKKSDDSKVLLKELHSLGPEIVIITDGQNGSFAYDGSAFYYQKIFKTRLVDKTGAGDAFASGFIAAVHYGMGIREGLKWGALNAASVIQHVGPQDGLLRLQKMRRLGKRGV